MRICVAHSCVQLSPEKVTEVLLEMSPREKEITQLLLLGVSNIEIAERLSLSQRTVHGHRNNVYRKLRVHNLHDFLQCVRGADLSIPPRPAPPPPPRLDRPP